MDKSTITYSFPWGHSTFCAGNESASKELTWPCSEWIPASLAGDATKGTAPSSMGPKKWKLNKETTKRLGEVLTGTAAWEKWLHLHFCHSISAWSEETQRSGARKSCPGLFLFLELQIWVTEFWLLEALLFSQNMPLHWDWDPPAAPLAFFARNQQNSNIKNKI